jgi:hypothetical protein
MQLSLQNLAINFCTVSEKWLQWNYVAFIVLWSTFAPVNRISVGHIFKQLKKPYLLAQKTMLCVCMAIFFNSSRNYACMHVCVSLTKININIWK